VYSCKKKDTDKNFTYSYDYYSPPTTPFVNLKFDDFTFRDIIPQRSPTQLESKRLSCAFSDISSGNNTTSSEEQYRRSDSEASKHFYNFQSSTYSTDIARLYRPRFSRSSSSQTSYSVPPSLSHTSASLVIYSLPCTPATTRTPSPRTKPVHSSSYSANLIDLVTSLTAPLKPKQYLYKSPAVSKTSASTIQGEIVYVKLPIPSQSVASGSLSRLLALTPR
jgi:hypothetical protein